MDANKLKQDVLFYQRILALSEVAKKPDIVRKVLTKEEKIKGMQAKDFVTKDCEEKEFIDEIIRFTDALHKLTSSYLGLSVLKKEFREKGCLTQDEYKVFLTLPLVDNMVILSLFSVVRRIDNPCWNVYSQYSYDSPLLDETEVKLFTVAKVKRDIKSIFNSRRVKNIFHLYTGKPVDLISYIDVSSPTGTVSILAVQKYFNNLLEASEIDSVEEDELEFVLERIEELMDEGFTFCIPEDALHLVSNKQVYEVSFDSILMNGIMYKAVKVLVFYGFCRESN